MRSDGCGVLSLAHAKRTLAWRPLTGVSSASTLNSLGPRLPKNLQQQWTLHRVGPDGLQLPLRAARVLLSMAFLQSCTPALPTHSAHLMSRLNANLV